MIDLIIKRIDEQLKSTLVDIVVKFTPKIVKMDGAKHKTWRKKKDEVQGE